MRQTRHKAASPATMPASARTDVDVAIVGAGYAGLAAARTLAHRRISFRLLEAARRTGGRAWTEYDSLGLPFDRGCAWLHQASINPLTALADYHGIDYAPRMPARFALHGHWPDATERGRIAAYLQSTFETIAAAGRRGEDLPASLFRDPAHDWAPIADHLLTTINAVEPDLYSTAEAAAEEDLHEDWITRPGLGTLFQRLAAGIPVTVDCPVHTIRHDGGAVRLQTDRGELAARCAIITVSTGVLAGNRLRFVPALPARKQAAIEAVPMGCAEKIALAFDDDLLPLPENTYLSILDAKGAFGFHARPFGMPMAVAYTGGRLAREVAAMAEPEAVAFARERLGDALGSQTAARVTRGTRTRWAHDPHTAGSYSAARPGRHHMRRRLAEPVAERLFFAGEATVSDCFATAHGAWQSGIRAATEALALVNRAASPRERR